MCPLREGRFRLRVTTIRGDWPLMDQEFARVFALTCTHRTSTARCILWHLQVVQLPTGSCTSKHSCELFLSVGIRVGNLGRIFYRSSYGPFWCVVTYNVAFKATNLTLITTELRPTAGKIKVSLCLIKHQTMKTYRSVEVQLHILDLGTRWRWVVSFSPRPLYHW
jgi:hypothetical protein